MRTPISSHLGYSGEGRHYMNSILIFSNCLCKVLFTTKWKSLNISYGTLTFWKLLGVFVHVFGTEVTGEPTVLAALGTMPSDLEIRELAGPRAGQNFTNVEIFGMNADE